ncbi:hypothetical protein Pcinc_032877 [Petrolisthes cinctipes]|uniref:Uncharacterized protein n=1 Tax=Petrolisthes cinctipes TaxID=88211 RepID=A0AAE1JYG5_PETCI|nr:hypothetical protein Pcinc_032877 [Petrolisthes cinctipes]
MGTMSEKSESDHSDKSGVRAVGRSDMRVSVMYRGMVYRVRGIKVLCSVITAVILLLVAIVGLGVWMLVSAYAQENALSVATNATSLTQGTESPSSTPYTIDFNAPSASLEEMSLPAVIPNTVSSEDLHVNEAIGHFQGVTPVVSSSTRAPAPDPDYGIFSGLLDVGDGSKQVDPPPVDSENDSVMQHSDTSSILAPVPPHYHTDNDHLQPPTSHGNRRMDVYGNNGNDDDSPVPILQGGLPDNIPRDIDPMLLEMGLPFPYPPSIPTRAPYKTSTVPQRSVYPRYREQPEGVTDAPWSSPPRYHHSPPSSYYDYDYGVEEGPGGVYDGHDYYYDHHPPVSTPSPDTSTTQSASVNMYTESDTSNIALDNSQRQWLAPGRGQQPIGITFPSGVTAPPGIILPAGITLPGNIEGLREVVEEGLESRPIQKHPGSYLDDMMHYYNKHERTRPTPTYASTSVTDESEYSQRTGLTEDKEETEATGYSGPPVVGYGDRPLRRHQDPVFQHFWDVYGHDGRAPARHDDRGPVPEETWGPHSFNAQEHDMEETPLAPNPEQFRRRYSTGAPHPTNRGPQSDGQGYPLPLRPDAERPPVLSPDRKLWVESEPPPPDRYGQHTNQPYPPHTRSTPANSRPRPWQINSRLGPSNTRPGQMNIHPGTSSTHPKPVRIRSGPSLQPRPLRTPPLPPSTQPDSSRLPNHRPFLGPLYDIYNYSKRLASTLLSFPSSINSKSNASREEYIQNEVELLEDYNKVFQQNPNTTSMDILPDMFDDRPSRSERLMLIDSSKLRSLSGFELSLITWTFLDFWEFLIEKVGTLSKEDLRLLEQRLERLRQNKDRVMTQNFMKVTANQRKTEDTDKVITPDISQAIAMAEQLLKSLPGVSRSSRSVPTPSSTTTPLPPPVINGTITSTTTTTTTTTIADNLNNPGEMLGRMWDPLGVFSSEERVKFMQFAIRVVFKFGRVYLTKNYALDCMMLLFCKDLNAGAKKNGMDGMAAKIKR